MHENGPATQSDSLDQLNGRVGDFADISGAEILQRTRSRTRNAIEAAAKAEDNRLVDGPPGAGKTTMCFQTARQLGIPMTYLAARTDLYTQATDLARDAGYQTDQIQVMPSPHRDCPSFRGDYGARLKQKLTRLYDLGYTAPLLHEVLDDELSCTPGCEYMKRRQFDVDEIDVLVGFYNLAYHDDYLRDRLVFIDEFASDSYETTFSRNGQDCLSPDAAVNPYLAQVSEIPFENYGDLIANRHNEDGRLTDPAYETWGYLKGPRLTEPIKRQMVNGHEDDWFHSMAPFLVFSTLLCRDRGNGFEQLPFFEPLEEWPFSRPTKMVRKVGDTVDHDALHILQPPSLEAAESVVALDGTPVMEMWNALFQENFVRQSVLIEEETRQYVKRGRGIHVAIVADAEMKPYSSGEYVTGQKDVGLTLGAAIKWGRYPAVISTKKALEKYDAEVPEWREIISGPMNYGKVRSSNELAGQSLAIIHGSPHPGDDEIKKWGLYLGEKVEREGKGLDLTYSPEVGNDIYESYVHNTVAQAILRLRSADDQPAEATVVVNTAAIPDTIGVDTVIDVPPNYPLQFAKRRAMTLNLMEQGEATTSELASASDSSRSTVSRTMDLLEGRGWVEITDKPGPYPTLYEWTAWPC